ncbi:glycosyltransferase family 2 protein [Flavobacterium sandaracinum]|uniref:Glycosyltransferase n=1 Tax=Flavobacterium sandaracinum TaxID=2541733 RepID=A0A4R5CPJ5_9FLAO|nr:glycosyltransferase [Flavobacterium sandaracinum]TDE02046.1 glycosyltransferase [Flavobacterium sandaracinum]
MKMTFTLLITTKNRLSDLAFTLSKISYLLQDVSCVIFDDGSTDDTSKFVKDNYPNITLLRNQVSKGLIHCRNQMLNQTKTDFAISLDDDAHFITDNALPLILNHFAVNSNCGVLAFRIYWGLIEPQTIFTNDVSARVQGFVGCGHVWRMKAWQTIPNYPSWFVFYGEEEFASYELFKKNIEIHYLPEVLVQHRVDVKARKNNADYILRLRRSLRSGWYLYFLFYPLSMIPKKMGYSIWMQLKLKIFKGDLKVFQAITLGLWDLISAIPKIIKNSNRLSKEEYIAYNKLPDAKIYWQPENKN